jgi:Sec-independent protein translocase protein TatA
MEILNIGPLELIIIMVLMFIILGPKDMVKTAQRIGAWVRGVTHSQMWREVWGISQDIRELPKKLMEDTGLNEALTEVQQTTQQVASELNTQLNEAKEAARVPEAEHLRLETGPGAVIAPPSTSVPAALPSTNGPPVRLDAVQPAVIETVDAVAPVADSQVPNVESVAAVEPAPVKKSRRKKQVAAEVIVPAAPASEPLEPAFPLSPVMDFPPPDFASRVSAFPAPTTPPGNGQAETGISNEISAVEPAPTPRPRKRRVTPKANPEAAVPAESNVLPAESAPVEEAVPVPGSNGNGASGDSEAKPARTRKPRQPRAVKTPAAAAEAGATAGQPQAESQPEAVLVTETQAEAGQPPAVEANPSESPAQPDSDAQPDRDAD